jgi:hypothetical protein
MINYDIKELMGNADLEYFTLLSDNRDILKTVTGKTMKNGNFFAVQKLLNKISVDEYTNKSLQKVEQNGNVAIEKEIETTKRRFVRNGIFNSISEAMSLLNGNSIVYILIDSMNTFSPFCAYLDSVGMPFLHVKYSNGKFNVNGMSFNSVNDLETYVMENYYP